MTKDPSAIGRQVSGSLMESIGLVTRDTAIKAERVPEKAAGNARFHDERYVNSNVRKK